MDSKVSRRLLFVALALATAAPLLAQLTPIAVDRGGNGLGLNLRRLGVTGRVLYVTAHPDDEHNGVLVRLSRGLGVRTALLTLTRGEGGQNAIGPERDEALGILRTEEILAVHRYDGVEQYFARAYEFGFSFDAEETSRKWGREETLGDVVRVVRTFRPDLILTMPLEGRAHQHHVTSAELARDAFRAAADPERFPEQIEAGLRPWQAAKLYQGGVGGGAAAGRGTPVRLSTAALDPLLGMSAQQFGALARANHRSQATRQMVPDPGTGEGTFLLVDSEPRIEGAEASLEDGLDLTLRGLLRFVQAEAAAATFLAPGLAAIADRFTEAQAAYDVRSPERAAAPLGQALVALRKTWDDVAQSRLSEAAREELLSRLDDQERETAKALALAHGLTLEARLDDGAVVPGQSIGVTLSLWNQGAAD
jgi:LmbE family N-acetylglucosaminyl deacetylase